MSETWKRWEGQVVNGALPLVRYLGGSDHSAVFLTERVGGSPQKAAIKLIAAGDGAEEQLLRWKQAAKLTNPTLIRLFECGRCELEGTALLYVVMELADEDLSQIVPERSLSADEVDALLPTVLKALSHLHGRGLVHGRITPSNIMAAGDQVKVASDTLRAVDETATRKRELTVNDAPETGSGKLSAASDMWSLGVTLAEVLTQRRPSWSRSDAAAPKVPDGIPQPFQDIVRHCLVSDPKERWGITQIAERLFPEAGATKGGAPAPQVSQGKKKAVWPYVAAIGALAFVGWMLMGRPKAPSATEPSQPAAQLQPPGTVSREPATARKGREPKPSPTRGKATAGDSGAPRADVINGAVLQQVMPRVAASARDTIEGKIRVWARVKVDPSGNVTEAALEKHGPSKYFARLSLEAAREWKFTPPQEQGRAVASEWRLRFGFRRTDTEVVPEQVSP